MFRRLGGILFGFFGFAGICIIGLLVSSAFDNEIISYAVIGVFGFVALFCGIDILKNSQLEVFLNLSQL